MATYLPGVTPFVPQTQVFTPDYKFLQNVLSVRQNRFDTNYKEINKLYGDVVYAPLSRADSKEKRDQYSNALTNSLKQVAGMDLSLAQNVNTAKALFSPFYQDKDLVTDMYATKTFQNSQKEIQRYKDANNRDVSRNYWTDGEKFVNYRMQDFINATPEEARKFNVGDLKYAKNPDIFNRAMEILNEEGLEAEDFFMDGMYIYKIKNGPALTNQEYTYVDENGKTKKGTKNAAMDFVVQALADDPKISRGMNIKFQNRRREYIDENLQSFGGDRIAAGAAFDRDILENTTNEQLKKYAELETELKGDDAALNNWLAYKQKYGIIVGSKEDEQYKKLQFEAMLKRKAKDKLNNRILTLKGPTDNQKVLQEKAAIAYISDTMSKEFYDASVAYSNKNVSRDVEVNTAAVQLEKQRRQIQWEKEKYIMDQLNKSIEGNQSNQTELSNIINENSTELNTTTQKETQNIIKDITGKFQSVAGELTNVKVSAMMELYQKYDDYNNYLTGCDGQDVDCETRGQINIGTLEDPNYLPEAEAAEYLRDPNNSAVLDRMFKDIMGKYKDINNFAPKAAAELTAETMTIVEGAILNDMLETSGLPGSLSGNIKEFYGNVATWNNEYLQLNPDSEYAKAQKTGYLQIVTNQVVKELADLGVGSHLLVAGPDAVFPEGSSNAGVKVWDYLETIYLNKTGKLQTDNTKKVIYPDGINNFYEYTKSTPLIFQDQEGLVNSQIASMMGVDGSMQNYLNEIYPNGKTDAFYNDYRFQEGSSTGFRSLAWEWNEAQGWQLNENFIRQQMIGGEGGYYNNFVTGINDSWSGVNATADSGMSYPSVMSNLFAQDIDFGANMMSSFISNTLISNKKGVSMTEDALVNFNAALKAYSMAIPEAKGMILAGNYLNQEADEMKSDPMSSAFFNDIVRNELLTSGNTSMGLTWSQISPTTYENPVTGETEHYSAYVFTIPSELLNKNKEFKPQGSDEKLEGSKLYSERTFTILVQEEFDKQFNNKHLENQMPSAAERIIFANGSYSPTPVPNGGSHHYYKNSNGMITQEIRPMIWDPNTNAYVQDPTSYRQTVIDPSELENVIMLTQDALMNNKNLQLDVRSGNVSVQDKNTAGYYQAYPGGPYIPSL